jgi:hypothetical protein
LLADQAKQGASAPNLDVIRVRADDQQSLESANCEGEHLPGTQPYRNSR